MPVAWNMRFTIGTACAAWGRSMAWNMSFRIGTACAAWGRCKGMCGKCYDEKRLNTMCVQCNQHKIANKRSLQRCAAEESSRSVRLPP